MNKVSVIVPIRRGEDMTTMKRFVSNSTYPNIELIIVDEGLERSEQRNIGIVQATGNYLLILDSDQLPSPRLIEECVELMKEYDAIYIPETIITPGWFARLRNWERQFYNGTKVDVVRFVRNDYIPLPFFNSCLNGPEDSDWDRKIQGKRTVCKNVVYHNDGVGIVSYFRKKLYYAKSMQEFNKLNPNDPVVNFKYRCWTVYVQDGKWKRLIRHPIYTLGLIGLNFVRGVIYAYTIFA